MEIYKDKNCLGDSKNLNPYTLIDKKTLSNIDLNNIEDIKIAIKRIKNIDVEILNKLEMNNGKIYYMDDIQKRIKKHNTSLKFPPKNSLIKKDVLLSLGHNTPHPDNIKITPLINTSFLYTSDNILSFYMNWLCSFFYLALEADILIKAFYYIYNKNKGKDYSDTELNNFNVWSAKQIHTEYLHHIEVLYNENSNINRNVYLVDFKEEHFMCREIFEDILYVLLNLILANVIIKYIKNININNISSEDFYNEISLIINKHYLNYNDEYKFLIKLRKFSIDNYITTDSLEFLHSRWLKLKEEEIALAEFKAFEAKLREEKKI